jgi:arylsulfatase
LPRRRSIGSPQRVCGTPASTRPRCVRPRAPRCSPATTIVGKWHVTRLTETGPTGPFDGWPLGRGFDRFYGFLDAETDQYSPELVRDNTHVAAPGTHETGYHLTEDIIDEATPAPATPHTRRRGH